MTSAPAAIDCPAACSASFDAGTSLQLNAIAETGYTFAGWSGACSGPGACVFSIGKDESIAATFTKVPPATAIASCRPVTAPGTYVVTADLSSAGTCLDIHDTNGVTLDCGGHTVGGSPALSMSKVDGFSITNCNFAATGDIYMANLQHVSNGTFQHDTFEHDAFNTSSVNVGHATDVRIDQNRFNAPYQQYYSQRVVISSNTFVNQRRGAAFAGSMILSDSGSANRIVGNTIDGKWVGFGQTEIDDGIVIGDESGVVVSENTISDVFECGIETSGVIANATISNNNITRTGYCGIGGWYWNSLRASTISGNVATAVPMLFYFFRVFGLRPARFDSLHENPADTSVFFSDNVFDGNRLLDPLSAGLYSSILRVYSKLDFSGATSSVIPGERVPGPSDFVLTNNVFRNNDFGHTLAAPAFGGPIVPGLIVDGGGNVCNNIGGGYYPLACR